MTRPYKRACHQTNFSEGEFRKKGTPFLSLIFFYFIFIITFFVLFNFLGVPWAAGGPPDNTGEII